MGLVVCITQYILGKGILLSNGLTNRASMLTYLYIIRSGLLDSDPIKIGVANNVEKRLEDMQTGNPQELMILYKIPMNSRRHAYMVESRLHKQLKRHNIRGEWFRARALNKIKVKELLEEIKHEKLYNEDDFEMISEAIKWV